MKLLASKKKKVDLSDLISMEKQGECIQDVGFTIEADVGKEMEKNDFADHNYDILKEKIIEILDDTQEILKSNSYNTEAYSSVKNDLQSKCFKIVVIGEFSRGKSTLINALIGENILPSNLLPTTAVLTKIEYNAEPSVKLIYFDGSEKAIDINQLMGSLTCLTEESSFNSTNIKEAIIKYPMKLFNENYVIVDTPGVNDVNDQNNDITYEYLPNADAAIMVLDPDQPFSSSDKAFLENKVLSNDIQKIFFVLNKSDLMNSNNTSKLEGFIENRIKETTGVEIPNVYMLSSKKALVSRIKKLNNGFEADFKKFENELLSFLTQNKGNVVIRKSCLRIIKNLNIDLKSLKLYYNMLDNSVSDVEKKVREYEMIKYRLKVYKKEFDIRLGDLGHEYKNKFVQVINDEVEQIIDSITFDDDVNNEIDRHLKLLFENSIQNLIDIFRAKLNTNVENIEIELNESIEILTDFALTNLSENNLTSFNRENYEILEDDKFLKNVGISFGIYALATLINLTIPVTILATIAGGSILKRRQEEKMKAISGKRFESEMVEIKERLKARLINKVKLMIQREIDGVVDAIDKKIATSLENVGSLIQALSGDLEHEVGIRAANKTKVLNDIKRIHELIFVCNSMYTSLEVKHGK